MKKSLFALFVAFWASVATVAALQALSGGEADRAETSPLLPRYTLADIAAHDAVDDCRMAIEGKVYDFTDYIPDHPTPARVMAVWCGREATEGMRTKGIGRDHSPAAWAMMQPFLIGELVDKSSSQ